MKLTTKLIGGIGLSSLLLVGMISLISYNLTRNALNDEIAVQQLELAQQTMDKIDRLLYERFNGINVIAENATITQYSNTAQAAGKPASPSLLVQRTMAKLESATGPWDNIDIVTREGRVLYTTNTDPTHKDISTDKTVAQFLANAAAGKIVYSNVFLNPATNKPTMLFMAPIRNEIDPNRPIVGVAAAYLSWPVVLEILQSTNSYEVTLLTNQALEIGDNSQNSDAQILHKTRVLDDGLKKVQQGNEQSIILTNENNVQTLTSYAIEKGFLDYQGNGWILTVETPASVAFAPAVRSATTILLALVPAIIVINALLALLIFRSLRPLGLIGKTAHEISDGDLTKRVLIRSRDEIGQLAKAFNAMADKLQKSYAGLEQKIQQRTAQLARQTQDLQKFQLAVENASDQVVITDATGAIVYANPHLEQQTGWKVSDVIGKKPWDLWSRHPDHGTYARLWESIRSRKEAFSVEMTNHRRDGQVYYVRSSISPIMDDTGKVTFFVDIEHDITQEKEEKAHIERLVRERTLELSKEHARLQSSLSNLKIGFLMTDTKDNIIFINHAAKQALQNPKNTATVSGLQHALDNAGLDFSLSQALASTQKRRRAGVIKDVSLGGKYYHVFTSPIRSGTGTSEKSIGTVLLLEDVSEEKVLQRSRDEFFSIASHELRTPLTAIRGNAAMLHDFFAKDFKSTDAKEILADIHESSTRLIAIVNDFLDMSRLEQGKINYVKSSFDVVKLSHEIIKEYDVSGSRNKLYLRIDTPDQAVPLVYADQNRVRQIIINLVGNALKFTAAGGITIAFDTTPTLVKVYVTDTGTGISLENQQLLFRKFQQAQSNILTRDATKGTGLGLYISRLMAHEMGGEVAIEHSELGKGSTFSVSIPIATDSQQK